MTFARSSRLHASGYRLWARGAIPQGGGTVTGGVNADATSGVQTSGVVTCGLTTAAPAGSFVECITLNSATVGLGEVTGSTVTVRTYDTTMTTPTNAAVFFAVYAP